MKVSIIVPNRNYAQYLPSCLDSIASQSHENIEVLLADGNSTDDSLNILKKYSVQYNWRIFSYSDSGQVDAISRGLEIATGDIQGWLNSDDVLISRTAIEQIVNLFLTLNEVDIVSLGGMYLDEFGHYTRPINLYYHPLVSQSDCKYRLGFVQPATFWKPQVYEHLKLETSLPFSFDSYFFSNAYSNFNLYLNQNIHIAGYRLHGENLSVGVKPQRIRELANLNKMLFGSGFRYVYLLFLHCITRALGIMPEFIYKRIIKIVYVSNNLISYCSLYRIPSI